MRGEQVTLSLFHTLALAVYAPLAVYAANVDLVPLSAPLRAMAVMVGVVLLAIWALGLVIRDLVLRAVVVSILLLGFALKVPLGVFLNGSEFATFLCTHAGVLADVSMLGLAVVAAFRLGDRTRREARAVLNTVAVVALAINLGSVAIGTWSARASSWEPVVSDMVDRVAASPLRGDQRRDIYYIVVDSYPRADTMASMYGFQRPPLLDFLRAKGFYIADEARTNYPWTLLSVASSLNMSHLTGLGAALGERGDRRPLLHLIQNSAVMRMVRAQGYRTVWLASDFLATAASAVADRTECSNLRLTGYELQLLGFTPLNRIAHRAHRAHVECQLDQLQNLAAPHDRPQFVFAHIMAPHSPFVFDEGGCEVQSIGMFRFDGRCSWKNYSEAFHRQTSFVAARLQDVIGTILDRSDQTPIIIVQADHGPKSQLGSSVDRTNIDERFAILSAYLLPDTDHRWMHDHLSPVNNFRIVFNKYFGGEFKMLPDKSFFAPADSLFEFVEVTHRIRESWQTHRRSPQALAATAPLQD